MTELSFEVRVTIGPVAPEDEEAYEAAKMSEQLRLEEIVRKEIWGALDSACPSSFDVDGVEWEVEDWDVTGQCVTARHSQPKTRAGAGTNGATKTASTETPQPKTGTSTNHCRKRTEPGMSPGAAPGRGTTDETNNQGETPMTEPQPDALLIQALDDCTFLLANTKEIEVDELTAEQLDKIQSVKLRGVKEQVDGLNSRLAQVRNQRSHEELLQLLEEHGTVWAMKGYGAHAFTLRDEEIRALCGNAGRGVIRAEEVYVPCGTCQRIAASRGITPYTSPTPRRTR